MSTYSNQLQPALQNLLLRVVWFFHPRYMRDAYIGGRFRQTKITRKASDAAENLQLYRVVWFFHPRSSCMMTHILADDICMTISGGRTRQLDIFCHVTGFEWFMNEPNNLDNYETEWFSQFHSCGTYSVLSRSPSLTLTDIAQLGYSLALLKAYE